MVIRYRMVGSLSVIFVLMISRSPGGGTVKLRATAAYGTVMLIRTLSSAWTHLRIVGVLSIHYSYFSP